MNTNGNQWKINNKLKKPNKEVYEICYRICMAFKPEGLNFCIKGLGSPNIQGVNSEATRSQFNPAQAP